MFKKVFCLFLFLLMSSLAYSARVDAYYLVDVESTNQIPENAYPGDQISLAVTIINEGRYTTAYDLNFELNLPEGFTPRKIVKTLDKLEPSEKETIVFQFESSKNASPGTYILSLRMSYVNNDSQVSETKYISVKLADIYKLSLTDLSISNYFPHLGDTIIIKAHVKNTGSLEARNVSVALSLVGSENFSGFILLSENVKELGNMKVGDSKEVIFKLKASEKLEPGVYTFMLNASCLDCSESKRQKFSIHVYGRPELIISGVDYAVEGRKDKTVRQGDRVTFSVQLDNLGKESAKQVVVSLDTDESFLGSKTSYVGEIEREDSGSAIFDLAVSEKAKIGYHDIKINITYLDELHKKRLISQDYKIYIFKAPEPNPYLNYVFIIVILILIYLILKLIIRQLAIRKL